MKLQGKVALVTGSNKGIGEAIIKELAYCGCNVVVHYGHDNESANRVYDAISNVEKIIVKADISKEDEVRQMFKKINDKWGHIDIVVNNAGIAMDNYLEDKSIEEFKKVIDVNLNGTFIVSKIASEYMSNGTIINITSNNAIDQHTPYSIDYDASKAGIISLTHSLAKILPNIRVNAIAPGWIDTTPVLNMNPDLIEEEKSKIIMNRFGKVEEIAKVVSFLASDDASYINDSIIRVDGGIK